MNISVVSTLTHDDEERLAAAMLTALTALLDALPIAYALRVETASANVSHHSNLADAALDTDHGTRVAAAGTSL